MSLLLALLLLVPAGAGTCAGFALPAAGPVVRGFAPEGAYAGHWGVDLAVPAGTTVRAPAAGLVTFAGTVAGNRTVTIDHGAGIRSSLSYLSSHLVRSGDRVDAGAAVGRSGVDHGIEAVHWSLRLGDHYFDPMRVTGCGSLLGEVRLAEVRGS